VAEMKKRMAMQNRQKSNAKKQNKITVYIIMYVYICIPAYTSNYCQFEVKLLEMSLRIIFH